MKFTHFSLLVGLLAILTVGCSTESSHQDPELKKAVSYVRYLASPRFLNRSAFIHSYPEKKPSQFVDYLFSTMGSAEWVVTGDPFEIEQLKSVGVPVPPMSVAISNTYSAGSGKQIVLVGDDQAGEVVVKSYLAGQSEPQFVTRLEFSP